MYSSNATGWFISALYASGFYSTRLIVVISWGYSTGNISFILEILDTYLEASIIKQYYKNKSFVTMWLMKNSKMHRAFSRNMA